jgi:hypothetical protein
MKTGDFYRNLTSSKLNETFEKNFGGRVNLEDYSREQLEDLRNRVRTMVFQQESSAGYNDLLTNETYQKNQAMLQLLNTRIKEMLGEDIKKLRDKMDQLSEAKKKDLTGDGKNDFDDVQVARMTAGGVPKKKAIAKATSDNFKEGAKEKCCCATKGEDSCPVHGMKEEMKVGDKKKSSTGGTIEKTKTGVKHTAGNNYGAQKQPFDKNSKDLDEGELAQAAKKVKKGALHKQEHIPADKKIGDKKLQSLKKSGTPLEKKRANFALNIQGKGKKTANENFSQFRHNVKFVNESLAFLINEDEEGKAKAITAASDIVNDYTSWMQRVGQYQTKSMIELADSIKANFGAAEAEQFKQAVAASLSQTLEVLTSQREAISGAVAVLAGEATPEAPMGQEPDMGGDMDSEMPPEDGMDMSEPDEMNPEPAGDEFAGAEGPSSNREVRESREQRRARKLAEAHSIISRLAK